MEDKKEVATNVSNELEAVKSDPELYKAYKDNANLGADNLGGTIPQLKIHTTGKSSKNELANGKQPQDGNFFHTLTQKEYEDALVHILAISGGYRSEFRGKSVYTQLLSGIMISDTEYVPFVTFLTGKKLAPMWEFAKEIKKWTQKGIPMFALTVKLDKHSEKNDFGSSWIIDFELVKDSEGIPTLVHDMAEFNMLKDKVSEMKDVMRAISESQSGEEEVGVAEVEEKEELKEDPDDVNF